MLQDAIDIFGKAIDWDAETCNYDIDKYYNLLKKANTAEVDDIVSEESQKNDKKKEKVGYYICDDVSWKKDMIRLSGGKLTEKSSLHDIRLFFDEQEEKLYPNSPGVACNPRLRKMEVMLTSTQSNDLTSFNKKRELGFSPYLIKVSSVFLKKCKNAKEKDIEKERVSQKDAIDKIIDAGDTKLDRFRGQEGQINYKPCNYDWMYATFYAALTEKAESQIKGAEKAVNLLPKVVFVCKSIMDAYDKDDFQKEMGRWKYAFITKDLYAPYDDSPNKKPQNEKPQRVILCGNTSIGNLNRTVAEKKRIYTLNRGVEIGGDAELPAIMSKSDFLLKKVFYDFIDSIELSFHNELFFSDEIGCDKLVFSPENSFHGKKCRIYLQLSQKKYHNYVKEIKVLPPKFEPSAKVFYSPYVKEEKFQYGETFDDYDFIKKCATQSSCSKRELLCLIERCFFRSKYKGPTTVKYLLASSPPEQHKELCVYYNNVNIFYVLPDAAKAFFYDDHCEALNNVIKKELLNQMHSFITHANFYGAHRVLIALNIIETMNTHEKINEGEKEKMTKVETVENAIKNIFEKNEEGMNTLKALLEDDSPIIRDFCFYYLIGHVIKALEKEIQSTSEGTKVQTTVSRFFTTIRNEKDLVKVLTDDVESKLRLLNECNKNIVSLINEYSLERECARKKETNNADFVPNKIDERSMLCGYLNFYWNSNKKKKNDTSTTSNSAAQLIENN